MWDPFQGLGVVSAVQRDSFRVSVDGVNVLGLVRFETHSGQYEGVSSGMLHRVVRHKAINGHLHWV
jgi:hypothetical protein